MVVLENLLKKIKKYQNLPGAEELIFNQLFEIKVSFGNKWDFVKDKNLDSNFYNSFCRQLATASNQVFDKFNPILATSIPYTKYRVQAMHQSIKVINTELNQVPTISIRIPAKKKYKINDFIHPNTFKEEIQTLQEKIKKEQDFTKKIDLILQGDFNILISGGTSSGKTTLLNAFLEQLYLKDTSKRVITIEDAKELNVLHENKDEFLVSRTNTGAVKVNYIDMINSCMRLRPDFILLGEVSIENSSTLLRIGNSGHKGMISTVHADTAKDALDALAINLKLDGFNANDESIRQYISTAIDYIVQVNKVAGVRRITEVANTKELIK